MLKWYIKVISYNTVENEQDIVCNLTWTIVFEKLSLSIMKKKKKKHTAWIVQCLTKFIANIPLLLCIYIVIA